MRSRLMVRFHLRQLNCRGFPLNVLKQKTLYSRDAGQPAGFHFLSYLIYIAADMTAVCRVLFYYSEKRRLNDIFVFAVTIVT